jgi:HEAT repeat protein
VRSTVALWLACAAIALAVIPAAWVLLREALRRVWTRRALRQVAHALRLVDASQGDDATGLARSLAERFDAATIDRALVELLRSADDRARAWGSQLFRQLGLVDRYTRLLRSSPKWSERTYAAEVLGLAAVPTAIPALVASLGDRDEDASVKAAAAAALAKLREPSAIPLLVKELACKDERSSRDVAEALVAFGPRAVPALVELLADPAYEAARIWAARILGRIGDPSAVDELVARLNDRDDRLRVAATEALGIIGDPRALHAIVRAILRDPAAQVRAQAAGAVARIQGERAVDVLVAALADPDFATRIRALEAFETMRVDDTSPLETALRDPNVEVRRRAALALERVGYLERIVGRLSSEDRAVRTRAHAALLEIGQAGLVESVAAYLHHPSFEVRAIAARVCGELGAKRVAPVVIRAITDDAWPVRAAVCGALGRLCEDDAAAPLVGALGDPEEAVREAAAEALTSYSPPQLASHVEALANAYDRGTVAVRRSVVVIAARMGGANGEGLLVRASVDPSDAVRLSAVTALGQHALSAASAQVGPYLDEADARTEPLVARLMDASIDVRIAAVMALGSIHRVEAFDGLLRALAGAPPTVRDCIAEALSRGPRAALLERLPELERSPSLDVRLGVAWTLGKIGDPSGTQTLDRFLRDSNAALRASAAGALAKISHPPARDALLGAAEDPDGRVRAAVVNALGRVGDGDERALAALERRARDPDPFVRNRALVALARTGKARVEARVRAYADGAEPGARLLALALVGTETALASVLDALAAPGGLDEVYAFLDREDPMLRAAFFAALHLEDPARSNAAGEAPELALQYEKTLRTSLDVDARRLAVAAIERIGHGRAIPALADALTGDPNETVRLRAATALAHQASDEVARRALVRAVADPYSEVAIVAARAIATQPDPQVSAALQQRLGGGSERVQEVIEGVLADLHRADPAPFIDWMMGADVPDQLTPAVRVLARMTSPATLPLLRELLRSRFPSVRAAAVQAVLDLDDVAEVAGEMDAMAQDPSEEVRIAVVDAVKWSASALTRWAQLRRDPSVRVRARMATALERSHPPSAKSSHKALEGMLGDASPVVRAAALASLAASPDPDGLRAFGRLWQKAAPDTRVSLRSEPRALSISEGVAARLSTSADPATRKSAVVALGAFGAPGCAARVLPALRDPSPDVRVAAIHALGSIDDADARARIAEMLADPEATVQEAARRSLLHTVG